MPARAPRILPFLILLTVAFFSCRTAVAVPPNLDGEAAEALEAYAKAERASGFDPRAGWAGSL